MLLALRIQNDYHGIILIILIIIVCFWLKSKQQQTTIRARIQNYGFEFTFFFTCFFFVFGKLSTHPL